MLRSCLLCPAARTRSDAASAAAVGRRDTGDWCMRIDLPIPAIVIRAVLDLHPAQDRPGAGRAPVRRQRGAEAAITELTPVIGTAAALPGGGPVPGYPLSRPPRSAPVAAPSCASCSRRCHRGPAGSGRDALCAIALSVRAFYCQGLAIARCDPATASASHTFVPLNTLPDPFQCFTPGRTACPAVASTVLWSTCCSATSSSSLAGSPFWDQPRRSVQRRSRSHRSRARAACSPCSGTGSPRLSMRAGVHRCPTTRRPSRVRVRTPDSA